jgi:hypothetical protein
MKLSGQKNSEYDKNVAKRVTELIEEYNLSTTVLQALLKLKSSSASSLLRDERGWTLTHVATVAQYFGVTIDELVFGDKDFIEKNNEKLGLELKKQVYEHLIQENNSYTLGKLFSEGYFKDVDVPYITKK